MREPGSATETVEHAAVDSRPLSAAAAHCAGVVRLSAQAKQALSLGRCSPTGRGFDSGPLSGVKILLSLSLLVLDGAAHSPVFASKPVLGWAVELANRSHSLPTQPPAGLGLYPVHTPLVPLAILQALWLPFWSLSVSVSPCLPYSCVLALPCCTSLWPKGVHAEHSKGSRVACRLRDPLGCKSDWRIPKVR